MGLFDRKRDKVPDLSRYQQYYDNQSRNNSLSNNAASTALRAHSLSNNNYNYNNNNHSNNNNYNQNNGFHNGYNNNSRSNSLQSFDQFNSFGPRSNSLTNSFNNSSNLSKSRSNSRTNSLTNQRFIPNNRSNSLQQQRPSHQSNQIIIHTTKTEDEFGRTKSITTETIQKFGSFEIVKRETHDLLPPQLPRSNQSQSSSSSSKYNPSYATSLLSNELGSIAEEDEKPIQKTFTNGQKRMTMIPEPDSEDEIHERPSRFDDNSSFNSFNRFNKGVSPVRSILKNSPLRESESDLVIDDEGSIYSDALETLPWEQKKKHVKYKEDVIQNKSVPSNRPNGNIVGSVKKRKQLLTEEEMYAKAMEIAKKKVYGEETPTEPVNRSNLKFKTTLRDGSGRGFQRSGNSRQQTQSVQPVQKIQPVQQAQQVQPVQPEQPVQPVQEPNYESSIQRQSSDIQNSQEQEQLEQFNQSQQFNQTKPFYQIIQDQEDQEILQHLQQLNTNQSQRIIDQQSQNSKSKKKDKFTLKKLFKWKK